MLRRPVIVYQPMSSGKIVTGNAATVIILIGLCSRAPEGLMLIYGIYNAQLCPALALRDFDVSLECTIGSTLLMNPQ